MCLSLLIQVVANFGRPCVPSDASWRPTGLRTEVRLASFGVNIFSIAKLKLLLPYYSKSGQAVENNHGIIARYHARSARSFSRRHFRC